MKSCLSCRHSRQYVPPKCRSTAKFRCKIYGFDVNVSTVPGVTVGCDKFSEPGLPFAFAEDMPAWLL